MNLRPIAVLTFLGALGTSLQAHAQERSLTREILDRAKTALFDLQYAAADSIARDVLALGMLTRPARIEALQIVAAANFPDGAELRREAQARSALTQLVRIDYALTLPRELASRGLDSLYRDVMANTFSISVLVRRENPIVGIDGSSNLRVRANKPASFVLHARTRDGIESVLLDSVVVSQDTTLQLRVGRLGRPILRAGEYDFVVTATEAVTKEAISRTFDGVAIVPPLQFQTVQQRIDSTQLKPERAAAEKTSGIVGAVLLGAATIALGNGLRSSGPIGNGNYTDNRHIGIGVVMALAVGAAAWFDRGRVLDKNIIANREIILRQATSSRTALESNARVANEYRASITLNPEWR